MAISPSTSSRGLRQLSEEKANSLRHPAHGVHPGAVTGGAGQASARSPAAVAVHDDRHMQAGEFWC
jgi:hypothetical protein